MVAQILDDQSLQFPIQKNILTKEETKEYHLKKLYELSLQLIREIPHLDEPTYEQKEWVLRKLKSPANTWRPCC